MSFPEPNRSHHGPRHTPYGSTYDTRPQPVLPPAGAPLYDTPPEASTDAPTYAAPPSGAPSYAAPTYAAPNYASQAYAGPSYAPPAHGAPDRAPVADENDYGRPRFDIPASRAPRFGRAPYDAQAPGPTERPSLLDDPFGPAAAYDPRRAAPATAGGGTSARRAKRHFIGYPLVAILGLAIGASLGGGNGDHNTALSGAQSPTVATKPSASAKPVAGSAPAGTSEPAAPKSAAPGIGDTVRDGKFAFTVTKVKKGVASVGDDVLGKKAQGQFVLISVTVKNIGDKPQSLSGEAQQLYNTEGKKYSADTEAGLYLDDANSFYEEINPGNSLKGVIVFDMPAKAKVSRIELHDSVFSGGVDVSLS